MSTVMEIEALGKKVLSPSGHWLFHDLNAIIPEPAIIGILGKSGQGKSTLLRILGRLLPPDSGTVRLAQKEMTQWESGAWRMKVSYVAQQAIMLPGTVEDNLRTVSVLHQRSFDEKLARALCEQLHLEQVDWSKPADQLSGGEKQRLALIRTLLLQPDVLLLDEVTASLDTASKQATEQLLVDLHEQSGTTILWVTHDLEEARSRCQRIWFLAEHQLQADLPSHSFFHAPPTIQARDFLQSAHAHTAREVHS
ncbi:putative ABC transporter ATP-binding protein YjkB [Brevibacillus agri]|uniref:ABC transporter ATP-binding protein YjkB n=1 Tax=Brevibacillus agri TaxID=51101 RepID=A0A3M8AFE0_9BACL|nr:MULTISPECIES: ATP-binding cassette domain-containing protein [Brevibacillus]ELK43886.1 ABC transporter ATP-binding protein [Brevibacillus agri BAB-2500]MBY0053333.1 ATP-binding cassette domain-containing protein [Brevibacillus agri]MDN4095072.1 ATP-binding cassette domain-containing protein [Brevibacillus agri]MDR9506262.1 ATP-binding cassette domain-containing protein [Brevibacillus agri]MED1646519.1 ATP-binding cassette domain-containing protein [Brevibacillus agri]